MHRSLLLLVLIAATKSVPLPDYIKLCHKSSPDFLKCLEQNIRDGILGLQKGNKNFGIPVLEPFYVAKLDIKGGESGSVKLNQNYRNVNYLGMADAHISNLKIDWENLSWEMDALSPRIEMLADYEMTGQLMIFPINGFGKSNTTLINLMVHYDIELERYANKGKQYIRFKSIRMDMKPEKVMFHFENILPGNSEMSKSLDNTINENAGTVFQDVKASFEEVFQQIYKSLGNSFLSRVPENELFLD